MSERYPFSDSLADEIDYRRNFGETPEKLRVLFHSLSEAVTNGDGVTEALGVWLGYPTLAEIVAVNETGPGVRQELWSQLDAAHYQAARKLADLVEREGMDSTGIHRSQEICQRFFHKCEGAPILHPDRLYDTWPDCVSDHNNELTEGERTAIREADALVRRLATRLEAKADENRGGDGASTPSPSHRAFKTLSPTQRRNEWMTKLREKGKTLKEIRCKLNAVAEKKGWEKLATDQAVWNALKRWRDNSSIGRITD